MRRPSFHLTIAGADEQAPILDPEHPDALIWLSPVDGSLWALGDTVGGRQWLRIPGVASYRFGATAGEATAVPEAGAREDAVVDAYRRAVLPLTLHVHGLEVLHASAVQTPKGVVAFCAQSHGGKSTIAYAFEQRGYRVWADDAVAFEPHEQGAEVVPLPFTLRLRQPSSAFFAENGHEPSAQRSEHGDELDPEPSPLAAVYVLDRVDEGAPVAIEQLPAAQGFTAVFPHAYWFDLRTVEQRRETMRRYLDLAARVPIHRVRYPSGFEYLPDVVEALDLTLADGR